MKNYTTISNDISMKLDSADTYRFTCLSFTPRKDGYTDSTFKQIGQYTNLNNPESENTIKDFVKRLKASGIIRIDEVWINGKRRNKYYFSNPATHFIIIKKELLVLDIPIKLKGFMIQLFSLTLNNSFDCNFSLNKIVSLIKVSKPTASKYLKELTDLGHIIKTELGYRLSSLFFSIGTSKKEKERNKEIAYILETYNNKYFNAIFDKTDWSIIKCPLKYVRSIEGGYIGKQSIKANVVTEISL